MISSVHILEDHSAHLKNPGYNAAQLPLTLRELRFNAGSVSMYAGEIDGLAFGVDGITEHQAQQEGFPILVGEARLPDHHPAAMPNTTEIYCRVIFARDSLQLLGGQILGGRRRANSSTPSTSRYRCAPLRPIWQARNLAANRA